MGDAAEAIVKELCRQEEKQVKALIEKYAMIPGGLIPALHEAQKILGFLPLWVQEYAAEKFELPLSEVSNVISYYSLFTDKPRGECSIGACEESTCYVKNTEEILGKIRYYLETEAVDTCADGKYSVEILRRVNTYGPGLIIQITDHNRQYKRTGG